MGCRELWPVAARLSWAPGRGCQGRLAPFPAFLAPVLAWLQSGIACLGCGQEVWPLAVWMWPVLDAVKRCGLCGPCRALLRASRGVASGGGLWRWPLAVASGGAARACGFRGLSGGMSAPIPTEGPGCHRVGRPVVLVAGSCFAARLSWRGLRGAAGRSDDAPGSNGSLARRCNRMIRHRQANRRLLDLDDQITRSARRLRFRSS